MLPKVQIYSHLNQYGEAFEEFEGSEISNDFKLGYSIKLPKKKSGGIRNNNLGNIYFRGKHVVNCNTNCVLYLLGNELININYNTGEIIINTPCILGFINAYEKVLIPIGHPYLSQYRLYTQFKTQGKVSIKKNDLERGKIYRSIKHFDPLVYIKNSLFNPIFENYKKLETFNENKLVFYNICSGEYVGYKNTIGITDCNEGTSRHIDTLEHNYNESSHNRIIKGIRIEEVDRGRAYEENIWTIAFLENNYRISEKPGDVWNYVIESPVINSMITVPMATTYQQDRYPVFRRLVTETPTYFGMTNFVYS